MWMKKNYALNCEGNLHHSIVARQGGRVRVQISEDSEPVDVDFQPVLGGKAVSVRVGGRLHLIHLTGTNSKGAVSASLDGRPVQLTVMDELRAQALESMGDVAGGGTITADIPGLVVELRASVGQKVHQGEPVIVVEAMKMQNELAAAVSGTVTEIPVTEGQSVNPGDVLVIIEPEPGG